MYEHCLTLGDFFETSVRYRESLNVGVKGCLNVYSLLIFSIFFKFSLEISSLLPSFSSPVLDIIITMIITNDEERENIAVIML